MSSKPAGSVADGTKHEAGVTVSRSLSSNPLLSLVLDELISSQHLSRLDGTISWYLDRKFINVVPFSSENTLAGVTLESPYDDTFF